MPDALRFAIGTFTRVPVPAPRRLDQTVVGAGLLLAPIVGVLLGLLIGVSAQLLAVHTDTPFSGLLIAALAVSALAFVTRGLHLDGLGDTADALGSSRSAPEALAIARRPDVGAFAVAVICLTLLVQVCAYAANVTSGAAAICLAVAAGTARLAPALACVRFVPPARKDGLGAKVAGSVPAVAALILILAWLVLCVCSAALLGYDWRSVALAVAGSMVVIAAVVAVSVRRLGGITGDVLGAAVELAFAGALVILALVPL